MAMLVCNNIIAVTKILRNVIVVCLISFGIFVIVRVVWSFFGFFF